MPTPTYTPLANITLGSAQSSVTFSSISQAYRDLVLVCNPQNNSAVANCVLIFNNDTGSNYNDVAWSGNGSSTNSSVRTNEQKGFVGSSTNVEPVALIVNVFDYSATDKHKTAISRNNVAGSSVGGRCVRWANTSAITTMKVETDFGQFASGTTFAIYGIAS